MRDTRHGRGVLLRLTALLAGAAVLAASGPARTQRRAVSPPTHRGPTAVVQHLDTCSTAYTVGEITAYVHGLLSGAAAARAARFAARGGFRGASTWGKPKTLADQFTRHGADFGARTADDYAEMAAGFLRRSQAERLPTKIDAQGVIRVYDPKTNTFGAFNPNATTRTFYKPTRGEAYWADHVGVSPWTP